VVAPHPDDETLCVPASSSASCAPAARERCVDHERDASEIDLLLIEKSLFARPQKARDLAVRRMRERAARPHDWACPPPGSCSWATGPRRCSGS